MHVTIRSDQLAEYGAYEEGGVLTLGLRVTGAPFESLIIQIDAPTSDLRAERQGAFVELDDRTAVYGGLLHLLLQSDGVLEVGLDPSKTGGIATVSAQLPFPMRSETRELVGLLIETFEAYPPRLAAGRPR